MSKQKVVTYIFHFHFLENKYLTHLSLASFLGTAANSVEPDQTPLNEVFDQVLHCLLTERTF